MFFLFNENVAAALRVDANERACVKMALADLQSDILAVGGARAELIDAPCAGEGLFAGSLTNPAFRAFLARRHVDASEIADQWESCLLLTDETNNHCLYVIGSDERGAMWGVYEICERFLKVDPMFKWTGIPPAKQKSTSIPARLRLSAPSFPYRGWFINDEDLLEGFCCGGRPPVGYDFHADYAPVLARIVETALRLKQNLIIPCSHIDLERAADEAIVKLVTDRGMFVTMHHIEPVGVNQKYVERYWQARGVQGVNYADDADKYEEVWRRYIRKWARYDHVIWQLGLRGTGDRPVWYQNARIPDTESERGALISRAISRQRQIVLEETAGKARTFTTTLWMEGMRLYQSGALSVPEDVALIMADFGPEQTFERAFDTSARRPGGKYGVYYHVGFWGDGPHTVQGNRIEKIRRNYQRAVQKGDTFYSVLNVSNIREFTLGIDYTARVTWDACVLAREDGLPNWCARMFGPAAAQTAGDAYRAYFDALPVMNQSLMPGQMVFMDGMAKRVAFKLMRLIRGEAFRADDIQNKILFAFSSADEFIARYEALTEAGIIAFERARALAAQTAKLVSRESLPFFGQNLFLQVETMLGLYGWVRALAEIAQRKLGKPDLPVDGDDVARAVSHLTDVAEARRKYAFGDWQNWYDGDRLIALEDCIQKTKALANAGEGGAA